MRLLNIRRRGSQAEGDELERTSPFGQVRHMVIGNRRTSVVARCRQKSFSKLANFGLPWKRPAASNEWAAAPPKARQTKEHPMNRLAVSCRVCAVLLLLALTSGCATRAPLADFPRPATQALAADTSGPLGHAVSKPAGVDPEQSGFYLLVSGKEAFEARLALIQQARTSLDLQYYAAAQDRTGTAILNALLAASRRGVRVRLLLDDLNLNNPDDLLAILAIQPNFEVRIFNPITTGGRSFLARASAMIADYDHLERRMHNKSLIADGVLAVIGGRNLADQYFDARADMNFRDLDVLAAGNLPGRLEASFDRYWNSKESYPLPALESRPPNADALAQWQTNPLPQPQKPADAADVTLLPIPDPASANTLLTKATSQLIWARAWLAVDNPAKVETDDAQAQQDHAESKPGQGLLLALRQAHQEFIILSAYFVP